MHKTSKFPCIPALALGLVCTLIWLIRPELAQAMEEPSGYGTEIDLLGEWQHFQYREFQDSGSLFNREKGEIPGIRLGARFQKGRWSLRLAGSWHHGRVDYEGLTNAGAILKTHTTENLMEVRVGLGHSFKVVPKLKLEPFIDVGARVWWRDIATTGAAAGLKERYDVGHSDVGIALVADLSPIWSLRSESALLLPFHTKLSVDSPVYGTPTLDFDGHPGYKTDLVLQYHLKDWLILNLGPYLDFWRFNRGPDQTLTTPYGAVVTVHEPPSQTHQFGLRGGVSLRY